jgi:hypothetical protein
MIVACWRINVFIITACKNHGPPLDHTAKLPHCETNDNVYDNEEQYFYIKKARTKQSRSTAYECHEKRKKDMPTVNNIQYEI